MESAPPSAGERTQDVSLTGGEQAILFADICDSTRLYESAGDAAAYALNDRSLELMREAVLLFRGTVIRTQGDGMLCIFPAAEAAVSAATEMQSAHRDQPLRIKIGIHFGPVLRGAGGDVYGDAVNLAARIASMSRAGETLLTEQAAILLPQRLRQRTRLLDSTTLKGKREPVSIYLLVDEADAGATILEAPAPSFAPRRTGVLELTYGEWKLRLSDSMPKVVLGRGRDCDLVVDGAFASRRHAAIELRRDRFVLTDQSTNGTYVTDGKDAEGAPVFVKRESTDLGADGSISLGALPGNNPGGVVHFRRLVVDGAGDSSEGPARRS
jgi:class 3 adenylate cyclase